MAFPDDLAMTRLTPDRLTDVLEVDTWAFPSRHDVAALSQTASPLTWERAYGVAEVARPERLVAVHASYPFAHCPVPGGMVEAAGLTWVGVHPQWRRRGLLRSMMAAHLEHCRDNGEPVSILFAAEPAIYGRFGYGLAAKQVTLTLERRAALRPVPGTEDLTVRMESLDPAAHAELIGGLHGAVDRPGWVTRETPELVAAFLSDPPLFRDGFEAARILIVERAGTPVGYALFRRRTSWEVAGPKGRVRVREAVATDPAVARVLWERLLDFDLTTELTSGMLAVDDPLLSLLVDVRAAQARWQDNLWLRIVDLPGALASRRFQADLDVVLEVTDDLCPGNAGRWRLRTEAFGEPQVTRTGDPAGLVLGVRELGAAYLGGTSLVELAGAGLVSEQTPGALRSASVAFGWSKAPMTSWIF